VSDNTPQRIGDYEIIRELGHGGMGKVYQVRNVLSDRIEAMKIVLPDLAGRSEFSSRFMREIKVLASLDHPNIAALRTAFTADNQFVMVMEYVEGVTLADRLEQGAFPTGDALNYIDQVLAALSYAHGKHIIHRDIKPGNMMLTPQGVVKLMDFGLARSGNEVGLTMTGSTVGSLDFMSPEQVKSQPTDERSDLYSVGASLYQMVTRQRMFSATSGYSIMEAHVKETPRPPIEIQPTLPKAVSDVIMMALAKDPAQRFQTADAFRNALAQVRASLPQPAAQAATMTMVEAMPKATPAAAVAPTSTPPPMENVRATPSAVVAAPAQSKGSGGVLLVIAAVLLLAVLAGAWLYKSRPHTEAVANVASGPASTPAQSSSAPAMNPPAQDASTVAPSAPQVPPNAVTPPPVPAPDTTPRASGNKRAAHANANASAGMQPGGSAPDSQAQDEAAAALARKKLLDDMEAESDHLDSRAAAVESSLDTLEQQMHSQGLGLRGDMVAARGNMRNDLAKAKQAMDAGDTDRARHFLDLAHHEVEKLEAFLGHR
jgi:eukaryotic-like serine/threonine-protein kinase